MTSKPIRPLLSVVIPSFNAMPFIEEAIAVVASWPREEVEIVVQDGGSTDGTLEYLRSYGDRLIVRSEPDGGQADALNRAIRLSTGAYIGWLNADDLYDEHTWEVIAPVLKERSIDAIYGDYAIIDGLGNVIRHKVVKEQVWSSFLKSGCSLWSGATFWSREIFDRFGYFDESLHYCMDIEYFFRVSGDVSTVYIPRELGSFRIHGSSKTGATPLRFVGEAHRVRMKYARGNTRIIAYTFLLDVKRTLYLLTRSFWMSSAWSRIRPFVMRR